jgi:cytochrome P450
MTLRLRPEHRRPTLDVDLCSRISLRNPQQVYRAIRDAGPVVWLPRHRMWAMGRFVDVQTALKDDQRYYSGHGVSFNPLVNALSRTSTLASDGEVHRRRRKVLMDSLAAKALGAVEPRIIATAEDVISDLLGRSSFDGVADFAARLPLGVVSDLIGLPVNSDRMLRWGRVSFDSFGPPTNLRTLRAIPRMLDLGFYTLRLDTSRVAADSWAASVLDAADRGELSRTEAKAVLMDFVLPSMDTTLLAGSQLLWSLGERTDVWEQLRKQPELVHAAVMEAVRLASPVRGFVRTVSDDHTVDGVAMRAGERVALLYASANMDETRFPDPQLFCLERQGGHLGWGYGAHACVGMALSKMELSALLRTMLVRVQRIEVSRPTAIVNNLLQGFSAFTATFIGAS